MIIQLYPLIRPKLPTPRLIAPSSAPDQRMGPSFSKVFRPFLWPCMCIPGKWSSHCRLETSLVPFSHANGAKSSNRKVLSISSALICPTNWWSFIGRTWVFFPQLRIVQNEVWLVPAKSCKCEYVYLPCIWIGCLVSFMIFSAWRKSKTYAASASHTEILCADPVASWTLDETTRRSQVPFEVVALPSPIGHCPTRFPGRIQRRPFKMPTFQRPSSTTAASLSSFTMAGTAFFARQVWMCHSPASPWRPNATIIIPWPKITTPHIWLQN